MPVTASTVRDASVASGNDVEPLIAGVGDERLLARGLGVTEAVREHAALRARAGSSR